MAEKSLLRRYARATLRVAQGVIEVLVHWLFGLVYGGPGRSMPPIKDLLLLDSASTVALKIRTGKVSTAHRRRYKGARGRVPPERNFPKNEAFCILCSVIIPSCQRFI